jgi:hypothetical protein
MAKTVDSANANAAARDICSRFYVPLSHFTVHAGGGTLIRHVRRGDSLSARPSRAWNRRSPARAADGMTGIFAAALAQEAGKPTEELLGYAGRHIDRAIMPVAAMGLGGHGGVGQGRIVIARILGATAPARDVYDYLWHGRAAADPLGVRTAYVRDYFARMLDTSGLDVPAGTLDPFIDYIADKMARTVPEASQRPETGKTGTQP